MTVLARPQIRTAWLSLPDTVTNRSQVVAGARRAFREARVSYFTGGEWCAANVARFAALIVVDNGQPVGPRVLAEIRYAQAAGLEIYRYEVNSRQSEQFFGLQFGVDAAGTRQFYLRGYRDFVLAHEVRRLQALRATLEQVRKERAAQQPSAPTLALPAPLPAPATPLPVPPAPPVVTPSLKAGELAARMKREKAEWLAARVAAKRQDKAKRKTKHKAPQLRRVKTRPIVEDDFCFLDD